MRRSALTAVLVVALVLTTALTAMTSTDTDYLIVEPPAGASEAPRSLALGATIGPHGRYYFPLRFHYTSDIGVSPGTIRAFARLVADEISGMYQASNIDVEFVFDGVLPIGFEASEDNVEDLVRYLHAYPGDGRFGVLFLPSVDLYARALILSDPWEHMPLRSVMPTSLFDFL